MCHILEHFARPRPGVMIEQGMLGKNGAARSITHGDEVGGNPPLFFTHYQSLHSIDDKRRETT